VYWRITGVCGAVGEVSVGDVAVRVTERSEYRRKRCAIRGIAD